MITTMDMNCRNVSVDLIQGKKCPNIGHIVTEFEGSRDLVIGKMHTAYCTVPKFLVPCCILYIRVPQSVEVSAV